LRKFAEKEAGGKVAERALHLAKIAALAAG
jgi:hypothetical protein